LRDEACAVGTGRSDAGLRDCRERKEEHRQKQPGASLLHVIHPFF